MFKVLQILSCILLFLFIDSRTSFAQATDGHTEGPEESLKKLVTLKSDTTRITFLTNLLDTYKLESKSVADTIYTYQKKALTYKQWEEAIKMVNALGNYYIYKEINHKKAYELLKSYQEFIDHNNDNKQIANYYITYAEAATYMQLFKTSLIILNNGIDFLESQKDSSLYEYGYAYLKAGENSDKINDITNSVAYYERAKEIFTNQKNELMYLWAQNGLAQLYSKNGLYDRAREARLEVFEKGSALKEFQLVAIARLGACNEANEQGNAEEELYQIRTALNERNNKSDVQGIVDILTLSYAVSAFARNGILDTSDIYKKELNAKIDPFLNNPFLSTYYYSALSQNALTHNQLNKAEEYAIKALNGVKSSEDVQSILRLERLLGLIYEKKEDLKKAVLHHKNYSRVKDSINNVISRRKYAYVQTQFETERKDLEITRQKQDIELLNAENKEKTFWFLFGGLILIGTSGFLWVYRSHSFAKKKHALTKHYSQELLLSQEKEREYISRELHDSVGQHLTLLTKKVRDLNQQELLELSQQTLEEVRAVSRGLHPPALDNLGITKAVSHLIYSFDEKYNIIFTPEIELIDECFNKEQNINLYRFVQEAMTNIVKHAQATEVIIEIKKKEGRTIEVYIEDNGVGFDFHDKKKLNSLGLKTMKERILIMQGAFYLDTTINKGTTIKAKIPY
ncbi:ATP-binding protein [Zhouia amylolytica]|uniref:ATP-binding protein n=1 Tax=Zhouia amylolytica TaxID=376730 RepID=UPI0020CB880B|nr:sensor histidine kinase [Zhouia amylolytica]